MKRWLMIGLALLVVACAGIKIPPCLLDGTCPTPSPTPTPVCPDWFVWDPTGGPHGTSDCVPCGVAGPCPSPSPAASASSPSPSPASPTPPPVPSPSGSDACPAPFAIKLGFGQNPRPLNPGFANTAGITPLVSNTETNRAPCAHKGLSGPSDTCAASEGCADHVGAAYQVRYGQPQAVQSLVGGFQNDPIERTTDGCNKDDPSVVPCGYNLRFATGCQRETDHGPCVNYPDGRYKETGHMRVCVSLPNLPTWRCQEGEMDSDGKLSGFGQDNRSRDVPK